MKRQFRIFIVRWKRYWHWYELQWIEIDKWNRENGYW